MLLECAANKDSPTVANFSFLLHYTRATTHPLFPRPFLFFKPKISVWMGFSVCKNVWVSDHLLLQKAFGYFNVAKIQKNSTTFFKTELSISESNNGIIDSAVNH